MSRVHNAMRSLEHRATPETGSSSALSSLVGALLEELEDDLPDDPNLETVRADLIAASRSYETSKKKDLALRFYLAIRSLLREHALLQERVRKAEAAAKPAHAPELGTVENTSGTLAAPHADQVTDHPHA